MKKILISLCFSLVVIGSWAGDIKVLSGDLSVFNNRDITASLIFDYSNLKIEGTPYKQWLKDKGSDYVRDWPDQTTSSEEYFIRCWNKDNDEGVQVTSTKGKTYIMVIDAREMHMGSGAASMLVGFGAGGAKLSGTMYIFKAGNNVPLLSVEIDGQTGRSAMTELARRIDLYGELAEDMVKTIKKTKQSKVSPSTKPVELACLGATTAKVEDMKTKSTAVKKQTAKVSAKKNKVKTVPSDVTNEAKIDVLKNAKGEDIPRRRKPIIGDFDGIASIKEIGVYLDFSDAEIMNRSEESFVRYMKTSAGRRDLDKDFPETWENDIKPELLSMFCSKVNEKLKDDEQRIRLAEGTDFDYVLKLDVLEVDEDGNNIINFLFVNMKEGKVEAQIKCESKGGHVGRFVGLLEQGFESASENFAKTFIDQID